jgi:hypothetical protein
VRRNAGGACSNAPPFLAVAWLHAPPLMPEAGGSALLSPSLPFPAGCEEHHYLQNTKNASNSLFWFYFS